MNIIIPSQVRGFFKLVATDVRTGKQRLLADWFPNLITNGGLDQIGSSSNWLSGCYVGSGNTAPVDSNTALAALIGSTTDLAGTTASVLATTPYYGSRVNTYLFGPGVATGTLAEIGVGASATALFSRALILDGMGNPTTVTVGAGESLTAFYEFRNYPPLSDVTGSVTINSVVYDYTLRAANVGTSIWEPASLGDQDGPSLLTVYSGVIGAITGQPTGSSAAESSGADPAYTPGQYLNTRSSVFESGVGNFAIQSMVATCGQTNGSMGQLQIGLSPALTKSNANVLTLTVQKSWTRGPV